MRTTKLQQSVDFSGQKFYLGLDVHKKSWSVTVRSLNLHLEHFTQPPSPKTLLAHLKHKFPGGNYYSAYEAGFCGTGIHEQLCKLGIDNIIVHPGDIPSTDKENKNKTDIHDSRSIAYNLERGNLHGIYIMDKKQQELRALCRLREIKVRDLTRATNRLKSFLFYFGVEYRSAFGGREFISAKILAWLSNLKMSSDAGTLTLKKYMADLIHHRGEVFTLTKELRRQVQNHYSLPYKCLLTVPGIGPITAIGLLAEIGDFNRFNDQAQYCSFLGLMPWDDSSGDYIHSKGIQPRCNKHLRYLLVEASWIAIKREPTFLKYYRKHAIKNSKHAIIKVARKLALIAKGVAQKLQPYQSDYYSLRRHQQILVP
ncbi:MAG: IS110 family transposase [Chitinophagales bacterium]